MALARDPATGLILRDAASGLITTNCNCCGDEPCTCDQGCRAADHGDDAFTCRCTPCSLRLTLALTPECDAGNFRRAFDVPASMCLRARLPPAPSYRFADYALGTIRTYVNSSCSGAYTIAGRGTTAELSLTPGGLGNASATLIVRVGGVVVFAGSYAHTRPTFDWADFPLTFTDVGTPGTVAGATATVAIECCADCQDCPFNCAACCASALMTVTGGASPLFDTGIAISRDNPEDPTVCGWSAFGDPLFRNASLECLNGIWTAIVAPGGNTAHQITWTAPDDGSGCPFGLTYTLQSNTYDDTTPSLTIECSATPCPTDCTPCADTGTATLAGGTGSGSGATGSYNGAWLMSESTPCAWDNGDDGGRHIEIVCVGTQWRARGYVAGGDPSTDPYFEFLADNTTGCPADVADWGTPTLHNGMTGTPPTLTYS